MNVEWTLQRKLSAPDWMFGTWNCAGVYECRTLEDELRQVKIDKETAIDAGRWQLTYDYSPRFRKKLLTINGLRRHQGVRVHSGESDDDTEGCVLVGSKVDEAAGRISGGLADGVRSRLEQLFLAEEAKGNTVWLNILNAPGAKYVDSGELAEATA